MVEVKFCAHREQKKIKAIADEILKVWNPSWLFVASTDGFFFGPCNEISMKDGEIGALYSKWAESTIQSEYLKILKWFEPSSNY